MLHGYLPFEHKSTKVLYDKILKGKFSVSEDLSEPALDLKWVSQIWIRQKAYNGLASVRIAPI